MNGPWISANFESICDAVRLSEDPKSSSTRLWQWAAEYVFSAAPSFGGDVPAGGLRALIAEPMREHESKENAERRALQR